jgi:hypothetical protein
MARGWESKSIESQQADKFQNSDIPREHLTPEQIFRQHQIEGLRLSRARVTKQLESASDLRHRRMLEQALAELDRQIERSSAK